MRASEELLEGKVQVAELGQHIGGNIWCGEDVEIAPDAQLYGPIYLGDEVKIKGGVVINGPAAIRDYTIVDNRAVLIDSRLRVTHPMDLDAEHLHSNGGYRVVDLAGEFVPDGGQVSGECLGLTEFCHGLAYLQCIMWGRITGRIFGAEKRVLVSICVDF